MIEDKHFNLQTKSEWVYLGVLQLKITQQKWSQCINEQSRNVFCDKQNLSMNKQQTLFCTIQLIQNAHFYNSYKLIVHTFYEEYVFELLQSTAQHLYILQSQQIIKYSNAFIIPDKDKNQSELDRYIYLQVLVSKGALEDWTRISSFYLNEIQRMQRVNSREDCIQIYKKFWDKLDDQFIKMKREKTVVFITHVLQKLKSKHSFSQKIVSQDHKQQQKSVIQSIQSKNIDYKSIQLKYKTDSCPGLFFDLTQTKIPQSQAPSGFSGSLKSYQKQTLTWMLFRQNYIPEINLDIDHKPYWKNYRQKLDLDCNLYCLEYHLKDLLAWNIQIPKVCKGGILADQMGLGKTIMIISLILAHNPERYRNRKAQTLIIVPRSLIQQWLKQLKFYAPKLNVFQYRGFKDSQINLFMYDVIITTQTIMRMQHKAKFQKSAQQSHVSSSIFSNDQKYKLIDNKWFRVILDEAHNFRNPNTDIFQSLYNLSAQYRWCLTGTPIQNSILDLHSMIRFLRFQPWCNLEFWKSNFSADKLKNASALQNLDKYKYMKIKQLLKGIMVRRKKNSQDTEGRKIVQIPQLHAKIRYIEMQQQARKMYSIILNKTKQQLQKLKELSVDSSKQLKKLWRQKLFRSIIKKIIKLRQICCHQFLFGYNPKFKNVQNYRFEYLNFLAKNKNLIGQVWSENSNNLIQFFPQWSQKLDQIIQRTGSHLCQICHIICMQGIITPCLHIFCKECLLLKIQKQLFDYIQSLNIKIQHKHNTEHSQTIKQINNIQYRKSNCPKCKLQLSMSQTFPTPQRNQFNRPMKTFKENQKIRQLLYYLMEIPGNQKCLIFTSFVGMAILIQQSIRRQEINCVSIKGDDSWGKRQQNLKKFRQNPSIRALIMTLKTGSQGLNLQCANHVILMDPWWNSSVQEQAISRAHRIGQQKEVKSIKYITKLSIESRIIKYALFKKRISVTVLDLDIDKISIDNITDTQVFEYILQMGEYRDQQNDEDEEYLVQEQYMKNEQGRKLVKQGIITEQQLQRSLKAETEFINKKQKQKQLD